VTIQHYILYIFPLPLDYIYIYMIVVVGAGIYGSCYYCYFLRFHDLDISAAVAPSQI
jgi:hypothetical protein